MIIKYSMRILIVWLIFIFLYRYAFSDENRWSSSGPPGGSVYSIEIHPQDPEIIYIGTIQNGIYKSTDGGDLWNHLDGDPQLSCMREIEIHPVAPETVYATSTEGMFKSTDCGISWIKLYPPQGVDNEIIDILIHPEEPNLLFAGGPANEWKSTNGGQSWGQLGIPHLTGIRDIALAPSNNDIIYLVGNTTFMGAGIFRSTDRGDSWQNVQNNLTGEFFGESISLDLLDPATVYVGLSNPFTSDSCLFKTTDSGQTWIDITPPDMSIWTVTDIGISPFENNVLYACTVNDGVFKSSDGGITWNRCNQGLRIYIIASMKFDAVNGIIYLGTYMDGIYKSTDNGASWQNISHGINASSSHGFIVCPENSDYAFVPTISGVYRTTDAGISWDYVGVGYPIYYGPGGLAYDKVDPTNIYLSTHHRSWQNPVLETGFYRSTDNGNTWGFFSDGLPADVSYRDIVISYIGSSDRRIFLSSGSGLYYSDNLGENWNACSNGLPYNNSYSTIDISPFDQNTIAAGDSYNRIFISYDRGINWSQIPELPDMSGWGIRDIEFHIIEIDHIYVASSGVGLFETANAGENWMNINNDLPVSSYGPVVSGIAINPHNPDNIFVSSSHYGIYQSHNGGQHWESFNAGLDTTATAGYIEFSAGDTNHIYFASGNRSVWTITRTPTGTYDETAELPSALSIKTYPNPFNSEIIIKYNAKMSEIITIEIYDIMGRKVRTLIDGIAEPGPNTVRWDGTNDNNRSCLSGVYFARLTSGRSSTTAKMLLLK